MSKSSNDCYYYFYGTCEKGRKKCAFRHSSVAKGSLIVCKDWRNFNCVRGPKCPFRHMESLDAKIKYLCKFEPTKGGCIKDDCKFLHQFPGKSSRIEKELQQRIQKLEKQLMDLSLGSHPVTNIKQEQTSNDDGEQNVRNEVQIQKPNHYSKSIKKSRKIAANFNYI